ncbi:MAG: SLATT domain-containing protein [Candidatus Gracilibacteria bacterium]|nr:SLATT domain-containing protein [Candidatus Gracilibacteria bacterium]
MTINNNLFIVREQFAQCVFNHKVQESACERNEKSASKITIWNIVILCIVLGFLIAQLIYPDKTGISYISAGVTAGEIIFLVVQLTFSFQEKAINHKNSALQYMNLRDEYKNFIVDIKDEVITHELINQKRDQLQNKYQLISELSGQSKYEDYLQAQKKLFGENRSGEEFTWNNEEINRFLPASLHI